MMRWPMKDKFYKELLNMIGAYVFAKDLEGKYIYVNEHVLKLFGTTYEETIGYDDYQFFDEETASILMVNDKKVMVSGETFEQEEKTVSKDGLVVQYYKAVKKPLYDDQGNIYGMMGISTDITDRKLLEEDYLKQKKFLDTLLDNIEAFIYMKDSNRVFRYVNQKICDMLGLEPSDIIGKHDYDILPKEVADEFFKMDEVVYQTGQHQIGEEVIKFKGQEHYYWSVKVPFDKSENVMVLLGFSTEITELYKLKETLKYQSMTDSLTKIYNRRWFFDVAEKEFSKYKRHKGYFSLILFDIDYFKKINDEHGHPIGDLVLKGVANHTQKALRLEDTFGRVGGEEFGILLPETKGDEAIRIAERLRKSLCEFEFVGQNENFTVTASYGVTMLSEEMTFAQMYNNADKALYLAKEYGRNKVVYYTGDVE